MNRSIHIIQLLFGGGILLLLLTGCIRENRDNCPPETAVRSVVLKVMDTVTGRDITENGEAGGAELYLFGPTGEYTGHVSVTSDEIMHRIPVMLPERNLAGCRISAWTNVGAGQQFHIPDDGSRLEIGQFRCLWRTIRITACRTTCFSDSCSLRRQEPVCRKR